jgi:hypothetical protein
MPLSILASKVMVSRDELRRLASRGRAEVNLDGLDSAAFRPEELSVANDVAAFELAFVEDEGLVALLEELHHAE